jgi:hypothetical protein
MLADVRDEKLVIGWNALQMEFCSLTSHELMCECV